MEQNKRSMNLLQSFRRLGQQMGGWKKAGMSQQEQIPLIEKLYAKNDFKIVMTCGACPEQYDIFKMDKQVAYYRLRHGEFRVDVPKCGGDIIYEAEPNGDGMFDDNERLTYLTSALRAVQKHYKLINGDIK